MITDQPKITGIIPARMASSRFPGKPLIDLMGFTMIEHVWLRSKLCEQIDEVYIATCDTEIKNKAENFGAKVIMTDSSHEMCMDRVVEAASNVKSDIIIVIQGDEPLITPGLLTTAIDTLIENKTYIAATLAQKISDLTEIDDPNRVKMVWNKKKEVLYISREPIPSSKKTNKKIDYYKMVCIYVMYYDFLMKYNTLDNSNIENIESIDMLRIVDNGYSLGVEVVDSNIMNIDIPEDVELVNELLKKDKLFKQYEKQ
jgi:3-deoxy-manno-octulosonate cytidylyltransferase (CMP-KDO synthetase)